MQARPKGVVWNSVPCARIPAQTARPGIHWRLGHTGFGQPGLYAVLKWVKASSHCQLVLQSVSKHRSEVLPRQSLRRIVNRGCNGPEE